MPSIPIPPAGVPAATTNDDGQFSGPLPDGTEVSACGVPWDWAAVCFAPVELQAERVSVDRKLREARARIDRARTLPRSSPEWDPYGPSGASDGRTELPSPYPHFPGPSPEPSRWVVNDDESARAALNELSMREAANLKARLSAGELRAIGRRQVARAPLEWMPRALWEGAGPEVLLGSGPYGMRLRFPDAGQVWFMPYVTDPAGIGLPPALAAIGYGEPDVAHSLRNLERHPC